MLDTKSLKEEEDTPTLSSSISTTTIRICCQEVFEEAILTRVENRQPIELTSYLPAYGLLKICTEGLPTLFRTRGMLNWGIFDSNTALFMLGNLFGMISWDEKLSTNLNSLQKTLSDSKKVVILEPIPNAINPTHNFIVSSYGKPNSLLLFIIKYKIPGQDLLSTHRLALVIGLEYTLLRYYDLERQPPPREAELAMLKMFDSMEQVILPGGQIVHAQKEPTLCLDEHVLLPPHPVLQLHSPQGTIIFTKIQTSKTQDKLQSFIVHIRPGWPHLKEYLLNKKENPLFRLHVVAKEAEGNLALELWRILDSEHGLIKKQFINRFFTSSLDDSHHSRMDVLQTLKRHDFEEDYELSVCIDSSSRWINSPDIVWPLRFYDPYVSGIDSSLSVALHFLHQLRNEFYEGSDRLKRDLQIWFESLCTSTSPNMLPSPAPPLTLPALISKLRHRWLQEFQAPQTMSISHALANSRDYADPALRNKYHLVVDTNVFLRCAQDNFEFFELLRINQSIWLVIIVPFVTIRELDWQKHESKNEEKKLSATNCIRYINKHSTSSFLVIQSMDEDNLCTNHSASTNDRVASINTEQDFRFLESAKSRHLAGLKTLVLTQDKNLQNSCTSIGLQVFSIENISKVLYNSTTGKLSPEHWATVIDNENNKRTKVRT